MSYDEHLISMAGGDGDMLDQIQRRVAGTYPGHWYAEASGGHRADVLATHEDGAVVICEHAGDEADFIAYAPADIRTLLALVREQQARIERVEAVHKPKSWTKYGIPCFDEFDSPTARINGCTCGNEHYPCPTIAALEPTP